MGSQHKTGKHTALPSVGMQAEKLHSCALKCKQQQLVMFHHSHVTCTIKVRNIVGISSVSKQRVVNEWLFFVVYKIISYIAAVQN